MNEQITVDTLANTSDTLDIGAYSASSTTINDPSYWSTTVATNVWTGNNPNKEVNEADIFRQITSLLGIKIANVKITEDKIVLYGRRNKKKYIIEIECGKVTVMDEKGKVLTEMTLSFKKYDFSPSSGGTITINPPYVTPYVYPSPATSTPYYPLGGTTTCSSDTYTIASMDPTTGTYTLQPLLVSNAANDEVNIYATKG